MPLLGASELQTTPRPAPMAPCSLGPPPAGPASSLPFAPARLLRSEFGIREASVQGQTSGGRGAASSWGTALEGAPPGHTPQLPGSAPSVGGAVPRTTPFIQWVQRVPERRVRVEHVPPQVPVPKELGRALSTWRLPRSWPSRVSDSLGQKARGHGVTLLRFPVLLPLQDAGGQEPLLTPSCLGPAGGARRTGLGDGRAPSLPLRSSCLQCLTFSSNFLFSLLGLLALAVGLWGLAVKGSLGSSWGGPLPTDPMLGLVLGGLAVSAVSLAGCLGALCESACLLRCFSGGLLAFLALEVVGGLLLAALWGPLRDGMELALRAAVTHYQDDPDLRFLVDQVQLGLQCCGAASYEDWQQNP